MRYRSLLLMPALALVIALPARAGGPAVVVLAPAMTCWDTATYFRTNFRDEVVDYCHAGGRRHYVPGSLECFYLPVRVCAAFTPTSCPAGCGAVGFPSCPPGCDLGGSWSETRHPLDPIAFPCPEGRAPPECSSRLARTR
jgi:hypothetical protein